MSNLLSKDTGYQGHIWNAGLTVGYQLLLSRNISLDFNLGLGYTCAEYDSFELTNGRRTYKERSKTKKIYTESGEQQAAWIFTPAAPSRYTLVEGTTKVTVIPNIYVCGYRYVSDGDYINTIWKNGNELYTLALSKTIVNSLAISGDDVYTAGVSYYTGNPVSKVWKNNVPIFTINGFVFKAMVID